MPSVSATSAAARGLKICQVLFGDRFVERADALAISLSNLNPQNHLGIALCNFTRMEHGETWGQNENNTDSVGRLLEALDAERPNGTAAVLEDFVRRVGDARAAGAGSGGSGGGSDDGGGGFPGVLLALIAIPAALFGYSRWKRRKRDQAEFEQVKAVARDDVIALGQDIRALDLDVAADEVERRFARWSPPAARYRSGVLAKYAALVGSAAEGAVTTGARMTASLERR